MKELDFNNGNGNGFKIPDNYFKDFDADMMSKISEDNLKAVIPNTGFTVPDKYFDTLQIDVESKIQTKKTSKVIQLFENSYFKAGMAVAASLIVYFSFFNSPMTSSNFDKLETSSIDNYLSNISFTNDELANLLENEDLNLSYLEETQINGDALQSYLEDQLTIDDLMNE